MQKAGRISLLLALALCAATTLVAARAATVSIAIDQVAFPRAEVTVKIGDTVEWVNNDIVDHTATAKSNDWNLTIPAGKKASVVMKKAGEFPYFCRFHPNMTARLVVTK